jgi:hypothetical protein
MPCEFSAFLYGFLAGEFGRPKPEGALWVAESEIRHAQTGENRARTSKKTCNLPPQRVKHAIFHYRGLSPFQTNYPPIRFRGHLAK